MSWYDICLEDQDYIALEEFRHRIRDFLRFSEEAASYEGLEPQQHQMLLTIRALSARDVRGPTIGVLADRLIIRHHSAVGMINRLVERGLVERVRGGPDRRQVHLKLSDAGLDKLARLSKIHQEELGRSGPQLVKALGAASERWSAGK
ncbi:MAG: winged helix-turn-helix transcriptional regulator [Acidobacteriia bacterium]|nr:winged helix-turn-helix transcriptional regulator [Terriglobia bacterium]